MDSRPYVPRFKREAALEAVLNMIGKPGVDMEELGHMLTKAHCDLYSYGEEASDFTDEYASEGDYYSDVDDEEYWGSEYSDEYDDTVEPMDDEEETEPLQSAVDSELTIAEAEPTKSVFGDVEGAFKECIVRAGSGVELSGDLCVATNGTLFSVEDRESGAIALDPNLRKAVMAIQVLRHGYGDLTNVVIGLIVRFPQRKGQWYPEPGLRRMEECLWWFQPMGCPSSV